MKKIIVILFALGLLSCSHNTKLSSDESVSLTFPPEFDLVPSIAADSEIEQKPFKNLDQKDLKK